jgi:histidine triad (HIT) family protein
MDDCIFCKIIAGKLPCHKIYEDEDFISFLDINPVSEGHVLVLPKKHFATLLDVDPAIVGEYLKVVQKVARRVCQALGVKDFNVVNANGRLAQQSEDHVHYHIVPRRPADGIDLWFHGRKKTSQEELAALAKKLAL